MSVEVTMRRGGGAVEVLEDLSGIQRVEFLELAHRAFNGESSQSRIVFDDDNGEVASDLNLPVGLTKIQMSAHNVMVVTETATTPPTVIGRGRYASKMVKRADHAIGRARQVEITMDDANMHLRGVPFLDPEERPEETDVERMTWLLGAYLQGSPRFTTNLTSRIIGDDPVTMPAHTYDAGTQPIDLMNDCIRAAEKIGFVTIDDELYYAPVGDESYRASMRISDREEEHNFESSCPGEFAPVGSLGAAESIDGANELSQVVPGPRAEVVDLVLAQNAAVGQCIVCIVGHTHNANPANAIWDDAGNTYILAAEHRKPISGDQPRVLIYYSNLTANLSIGQKIRWEVDVGSSILSTDEVDPRVISAWLFDGALSAPVESGTGSGFTASPSVAVGGSTGLLVAGLITKLDDPDTITDDPDWTSFTQRIADYTLPHSMVAGGFRVNDAGGETWTGSISQTRDWAMVGAYFSTGPTDPDTLPTFPPIDPTVIEEGQELLSGGVLRFGGGQHVSEVRPSIADEYDYWVETINDDGAADAADAASRLSKAIDEQQYEGRTYDVGVLLRSDQVCLVKPGQMIDIKARALPDADDQYATRRIAELRRAWAGPGHYMHLFKLDRPLRSGRRTPGGGDLGAKALATKPSTAAQMPYDGTASGSASETVQEAIDEAIAAAAHPNLATHDALGLATQAELDAHAATSHGAGGGGHILITSEPAGSPLVFADLLQNSEGTDLLYADE